MNAPALKTEFDYYVAHQAELVKKYKGRYIVIVGNAVLGAYGSTLEAITATEKTHAMGTFFVQKCEGGKENYTQSFHSRVSFA